jgi:hypothetical protein
VQDTWYVNSNLTLTSARRPSEGRAGVQPEAEAVFGYDNSAVFRASS